MIISTRRSKSSRRAVAGLADGTPEKAAALAALSNRLAFHGDTGRGQEAATAALTVAELLEDWPTVVRAFNPIGFICMRQGRVQEATALYRRALELALEHDLTIPSLRTYNNLADISLQKDRFAEAVAIAEPGLTLAKERGNRLWEQAVESDDRGAPRSGWASGTSCPN